MHEARLVDAVQRGQQGRRPGRGLRLVERAIAREAIRKGLPRDVLEHKTRLANQPAGPHDAPIAQPRSDLGFAPEATEDLRFALKLGLEHLECDDAVGSRGAEDVRHAAFAEQGLERVVTDAVPHGRTVEHPVDRQPRSAIEGGIVRVVMREEVTHVVGNIGRRCQQGLACVAVERARRFEVRAHASPAIGIVGCHAKSIGPRALARVNRDAPAGRGTTLRRSAPRGAGHRTPRASLLRCTRSVW